MSEENLTKKEIYDLKKSEADREHANASKTRKAKRVLMWVGVLILLIGAVWGMVKLSDKPSDTGQAMVLSSVLSDDWIKGDKETKVILIEYGDFQCPACAAYHPLVEKLIAEHGKDFQFVYRHFPLQQHANAKPAAYASEAAGKQGKFWEMYNLIYPRQNDWSEKKNADDIFLEYAGSLGLNLDQFKKDRDSQEAKDKVKKDYDSGIANKVNATPTFFLNGKKIQPQSYEEFANFIKQAQPAENTTPTQ
ncbi:MAG: DsbA family protein [Candidatus Yanofskybacteria bacterium]|nr:DsbA family protein [Candidatus Yanofskybacteria bacterium]